MAEADPVPEHLLIDQPEQLAALTSPVRLELLELIGIWGPCAVADVAERMERAPDSLYYHVKKLVSVGLLEHVRDRRKGQRSEAIYRLPARQLEVPRSSEGAAREQTSKAIHAILRLAGRELDTALDDDEALDEGPKRRLYGRRMNGRLSWKAIGEVNRHIAEIEAIFAREGTRRGRNQGHPAVVTLILTPGKTKEES